MRRRYEMTAMVIAAVFWVALAVGVGISLTVWTYQQMESDLKGDHTTDLDFIE